LHAGLHKFKHKYYGRYGLRDNLVEVAAYFSEGHKPLQDVIVTKKQLWQKIFIWADVGTAAPP
jgi:hypothetical protein